VVESKTDPKTDSRGASLICTGPVRLEQKGSIITVIPKCLDKSTVEIKRLQNAAAGELQNTLK
jgi:hypothetical protein